MARWYFNEDKSKLVAEGDPSARFLAAGDDDDLPEGFSAPKKADKPADKAVKQAENK